MKNKYKVVALVPLEFSVEGSSDSKEAIESIKNIFEACRDDKDYADIVISIAAMTVSSASSMGKRVILMHSTTVHGFLPTQTLLQNSMANRFLSRNPTRNSTKPIFGPSLPLGLKQT